jgi:hypothetical protein
MDAAAVERPCSRDDAVNNMAYHNSSKGFFEPLLWIIVIIDSQKPHQFGVDTRFSNLRSIIILYSFRRCSNILQPAF